MAMVQYPDVIPIDAMATVIDVVRTRAFKERAGDFGLAIWNAQGYAQRRVLVNAPADASSAIKMRGMSLNDEQACALLKSVTDNATAEGQAKGVINMIPWEQILQWLLQKALEAYLHQYNL